MAAVAAMAPAATEIRRPAREEWDLTAGWTEAWAIRATRTTGTRTDNSDGASGHGSGDGGGDGDGSDGP